MAELKINDFAKLIRDYRERKGFETSWNNMPTKLMLCVTELSEAMEAHRKNDIGNFNEEIADTMIRLMDITSSLGIDIETEIINKMAKNQGREFRHGKSY